MSTILVTGGAGFIGSHTVVELLRADHDVVVVDNFVNSCETIIDKIGLITGKSPEVYKVDLCDLNSLEEIFRNKKIDAVIHFAALKSVNESIHKPLQYYTNNIESTINVCKMITKYNVPKLIFSSSANVYGNAQSPVCENFEIGSTTNPYGQTKVMGEQILQDYAMSNPNASIVLLRYFNPIGANKTGLIGDIPKGTPSNLMPYITQVAKGIRDKVYVYGDDYDTEDGTGVRDYIHVVDLALAHIKAIEYNKIGVHIFNIGTGTGYSVLDVIKTFEKANNIKVPYEIVDRREGDIAVSYADVNKAKEELGFETKYNLLDMCRDSWNFERRL